MDLCKHLILFFKELLHVFLVLDQIVVLLINLMLQFLALCLQLVTLLTDHAILVLVPRQFFLDLVFLGGYLPQLLCQSLITLVRLALGIRQLKSEFIDLLLREQKTLYRLRARLLILHRDECRCRCWSWSRLDDLLDCLGVFTVIDSFGQAQVLS